jgi:two-component system sensor kinase FixL
MSQHTTPWRETGPDQDQVIAVSGANSEDRALVFDLLQERLRFENLLARLSATFIHLPAEQIDSQIERGLKQIVEFLQIERSSLAQFAQDRSELLTTHSYTIPGYSPFPRVDLALIWPWYTEQLRRGEVLRFTRLPEDLPPEAAQEREWCLRGGLPRSHLVIPFQVGDSVLGAIGFGSFRRQRDWPDDLVQSLQLVGEIFANALARKRADLALRESEGRFRLMADTAPVLIWMSGTDKLCTYFNKAWLAFTGRPLHHELGEGWSEGVYPDDLPGCLATYQRAFDARREFRMEYRLRRWDGLYRWLLDLGVPRFESDGTFAGYIGSCIDITERKQVEEELRASETRLRLLLDSTRAVPWVADAQSWQFTYVGSQASNLLGYPAEQWCADKDFWVQRLHPDDRDEAIAFCRAHCQGDDHFELDYRMVAADGRTVWIHDIVNVIAEKGKPRILSGFLIDVTARRQAQEESRNLREQMRRVGRATVMGELVASIAHEVNQPLCAIVSNAQAGLRMLATESLNAGETLEVLQDIADDGQRASEILARIRSFLQRTPAAPAPVNLNHPIREVAAMMRSQLAHKGVAVRFELTEPLPSVLGDRVQLQQIILNLMTNGADAMDGIARELRELILRSQEDERGVTVAVTDAGCGLEPETLAQVFDAFFTTKPASMGMGLAICKSIVEAHGGSISGAANAGAGSTFQFTLPCVREAGS